MKGYLEVLAMIAVMVMIGAAVCFFALGVHSP